MYLYYYLSTQSIADSSWITLYITIYQPKVDATPENENYIVRN